MRLMTYNILDGAVDTFPGVMDSVRDAQPDLLVINEANGWDGNGKLEALGALGLEHYYIERCGDGDEYHVALLSREPFAEAIQTIHPLARAAILAVVRFPGFGEAAIAGTHATPYSEVERQEEMLRILSKLQPYPDAAIMGDLNALSPQDGYSDDLVTTLTPSQVRKFSSRGKLSYATLQAALDAGFADAAVLMRRNTDTTVPTASNSDPDHASLRLDYVLVSGRLAEGVVGYNVIKNATTDTSSDHYPVVVDIHG